MNSFIETLNRYGEGTLQFAWPILWQSSLLIAVLFALDFALRKKVRAAIRYALWLIVLVKLVLPPTFASPTNPRWWFHASNPPAKVQTIPVTVTYGDSIAPADFGMPAPAIPASPAPRLSLAASALTASAVVSAALFAWLLLRWRRVAKTIRHAESSDDFNRLLDEVRQSAGLRSALRLKLTEDSMSPAVCGLFRPMILLPKSLAGNLSREQLRAVLLHEAIHLRRGDVWMNCVQALLQIIYWWHPLLWLANVRIRRLREEAVDDAVMLALRDDSEIYAPTLLEVAKFAFRRPLATLGLIGILESRSALRQRIERLMEFSTPRKAGLTIISVLGILAVSAIALPMGEAPEKTNEIVSSQSNNFPDDANTENKITSAQNQIAVDQNKTATKQTKIAAEQLVQDGKLLYEAGKFDEATTKLHRALDLDPDNQKGLYYLTLVKKSRVLRQTPSPRLGSMMVHPVITNISGDPNFRVALHSLGQQSGVQTLPEPDVVTTSGNEVNRMRTDISSPAIHTSSRQETIFNELNNIRLEKFGPFNATPLSQIIGELSKTLRLNPKVSGLNFLLTPNSDFPPTIDPNTGQPIHPADSKQINVASARITIKRALEFPSLLSVLDTIIKNSDKPIKYSVMDFGIEFSSRDDESPQLEMRTFRVDEATFLSALQNIEPFNPDETNDMQKVSMIARNFFKKVGVDLTAPDRSIAFNERLNLLFVKATALEMDKVERAIDALNQVTPQIHMKVRFIEVPKNFVIPQTFSNVSVNPMIGILSDTNFRGMLRTLENQGGVETLAEPEVVTLSGRQTQMRVADLEENIITNFVFQEISNRSSIIAQDAKFEIGPTIDLVPRVLADGYTIDLTAIPSILQFWGYDKTTNVVFVTNSVGEKIQMPTVSPGFRLQEATAHVKLWDNQTAVIGNLQNRFIGYTNGIQATIKSESKFLAEAEKKSGRTDKELLIFVTATIVDPAGNRVHSDEELPFNPSPIPPQL